MILNSIVGYLTTELGTVCDFRKYPASQSQYDRGVEKPVCFVAFDGMQGQEFQQTGGSSQYAEMIVAFAFSGTNLYGSDGVLDLVDRASLAVVGLKVPGAVYPYSRFISSEAPPREEQQKTHNWELRVAYVLPQN